MGRTREIMESYNKEWKEKKKSLRRELRKWNKGKIERKKYVRMRKKYKLWYKEEKEKYEKEEEERINRIRTEKEAWKYINKFRRRKI